MDMKSIKFVFALLISISLFSCFNGEQSKGMHKLKELNKNLEIIKTDFENLNTEKIQLLYDTMMQDIDTIAKYTNKFPENKEWREAYSIYTDAAHMAKNFFKRAYDKEIEYSQNQLDNLKTDIENNVLETDSLRLYLMDETKAIKVLDEKIKIHLELNNKIIDKYNRTKPIVNQYIDSLKNSVRN